MHWICCRLHPIHNAQRNNNYSFDLRFSLSSKYAFSLAMYEMALSVLFPKEIMSEYCSSKGSFIPEKFSSIACYRLILELRRAIFVMKLR